MCGFVWCTYRMGQGKVKQEECLSGRNATCTQFIPLSSKPELSWVIRTRLPSYDVSVCMSYLSEGRYERLTLTPLPCGNRGFILCFPLMPDCYLDTKQMLCAGYYTAMSLNFAMYSVAVWGANLERFA